VEWAKAVVKVFEEEGIAKGSAAVTLNGHMVDTPVYMNAMKILDAAKQIEEKEKSRKA
jgi:citrate lyase subunit beta / citryl-CoA lyase